MFEKILRDHVFIDFSADYLFGTDCLFGDKDADVEDEADAEKAGLNPTKQFAVVNFQLMETRFLSSLVDRMRLDEGYTPFHSVDGYPPASCDSDGWYNFYIGLNDRFETKVDNGIQAVVCNSTSADEGQIYTLDLSEDEQIAMYNRLDSQCRVHIGKSCEELLAEARKELEERIKIENGEKNGKNTTTTDTLTGGKTE